MIRRAAIEILAVFGFAAMALAGVRWLFGGAW